MRRTQLYHTLLHYKFRLILKVLSCFLSLRLTSLKVKSKLEKHPATAAASIAKDTDFVSCETHRFQTLVSNAGQKYGGEEQAKVI